MIPRNVVVDHEPAELKVDPFTGCLSRRHDLAAFTELALRIDAATGSVAVADLHATVNLRNGEVPFVPHLLDEVIERVLMLREDQELHLRIIEYTVFSQYRQKLKSFRARYLAISGANRILPRAAGDFNINKEQRSSDHDSNPGK